MSDPLGKSLCAFLAWSLAVMPVTSAQQPPSPAAPVPSQIRAAHAVFISNGGGSNYFDIFTGGPDRAYNTFYADLQHAGQYELVDAPARADLIFEIRGVAPAVGDVERVGYNPELVLSIIDPKTSVVLWTTRANVRAVGTKKRRDRGFDESVGVLVSKLGEITGRPLSPAELKAVNDNSRMPTGLKVFMFAGLAATAGMAAWGAYRVSHPPAPPTLAQPTLP